MTLRPRILRLTPEGVRDEMTRLGVDPEGSRIMQGKASHRLIRVDALDLRAALILKQDMLSLGGDVALRRDAAGLTIDRTPALIMGTSRQIGKLIKKLKGQPFGLGDLADSLAEVVKTLGPSRRFVVNGRNLLEDGKTLVMGVLNVTKDSFSDGGRYIDPAAAVARGLEMIREGADIVDVGGESTRPGADRVDPEMELSRVIPVIEELAGKGVPVISVDTTRALVAGKALASGASIINDISGMSFDKRMKPVVGEAGASAILMHTRGRPRTMQDNLTYDDLLAEVYSFLEGAVCQAEAAGTPRERLCVDPGVGFGKNVAQNVELIARTGELRSLGTAVMVGVSRKSFIGSIIGTEVTDRLEGSVAAASAAVLSGADMVRVHDVAQTVKAVKVIDRIKVRVN
ncbi:MAG: dihydropteroate synthase [Deltaproteobacteria bacterium]|nr:dihydropteroate synthase [Deltaproteobacteria bacterium]